MARTFGGASTDRLNTGYNTHGTLRTFSIWANRNGTGGGGLGRMFDKRTASASTEVELFYHNSGAEYEYLRGWSSAAGRWSFTAPATGAWRHLAVSYDAGSTANNPVVYLDGVSQSLTTITPSGTLLTNTAEYIVGNREND